MGFFGLTKKKTKEEINAELTRLDTEIRQNSLKIAELELENQSIRSNLGGGPGISEMVIVRQIRVKDEHIYSLTNRNIEIERKIKKLSQELERLTYSK